MNDSGHYHDTFNARWVSPEAVAETFVPIPQFRQLVHTSNSLLLGPRGCGKTTLLKMLTREAQAKWRASRRHTHFDIQLDSPSFEAIYIPSDVRWSFEVRGMPEAIAADDALVQRTQRIMVAVNAIFHVVGAVGRIAGDDRTVEANICEHLIHRLGLEHTLATFRDVRCGLEDMAAAVRGDVSAGDVAMLGEKLNRMRPALFGHALDPVINVLHLVADHLTGAQRPQRWALCYDELEIAPEWLRDELVSGLRSGPQDVLLKLTWFPILPSGVPTSPGPADDFRAIRLWNSHVTDPKRFCEALTYEFLVRKFGENAPSPSQFLGRSALAADPEDEPDRAYSRDSSEFKAFQELARWDKSFEHLLLQRGIDPSDPIPKDQTEKDVFFRKVKPIVLLREAFTKEEGGRSRKAPGLYVGREAIYAVSEGNPRWLLGLLNDLLDFGRPSSVNPSAINISYSSQGRIVANAAVRLRALIKATPFRTPAHALQSADNTLLGLVEIIGNYFQRSLHDPEHFKEDPAGTFVFSLQEPSTHASMVNQLLEMGAIIYVGSSQQDVPTTLQGARFRLSFMLAPLYRLPFRNLKPVTLDQIFRSGFDPKQLEMSILS